MKATRFWEQNFWFPIEKRFDLLPCEGLVLLVGQKGSNKSTLATQLAYAMAGQRPFFGRPYDHVVDLDRGEASVFYLCTEGYEQVWRNLRAQAIHVGDLQPTSASTLEQGGHYAGPLVLAANHKFDLLDRSQRRGTIAEIQREGYCRVGIVDTLARSLAGKSDSDPEVMSAAVDALEELRKEAFNGGLLIAVHHMGKDESAGSRGSTRLPDAVDLELHVRRRAGGFDLWVEKDRNGPDHYAMPFSLCEHTVVVEEPWIEDETTSTHLFREVVFEGAVSRAGQGQRALRGLPAIVLEALSPALARGPISIQEARDTAYAAMAAVPPKYRATRFTEALRALSQRGHVTCDANSVRAPAAPNCTDTPLNKGCESVLIFGATQEAPSRTENAPKLARSVQ